MKRLLSITSFFLFCICLLNGQAITKDLTVEIDGVQLEVLVSRMDTLIKGFEEDSVLNIDNEGSYIFKNNELVLFICDKNGDNILDMIRIYSNEIITWNNIKRGNDFVSVKKGFPKGIFDIDGDYANYITYKFLPNGEQEVNMSFYFETGENRVYYEGLPQIEYEKILLTSSKLEMIVINNPN